MGVSTAEQRNLASILSEAQTVLSSQPGHICLPSFRPILFVSDPHGDAHLVYRVHDRYEKTHHIVWLGDLVDRAPPKQPHGSYQTALYLLNALVENPDGITLIKGDHEIYTVNRGHGFLAELNQLQLASYFMPFNDVFKQFPISARTPNGIIALHGGLPGVESNDEFENLPKEIDEFTDHLSVSQVLTNDHVFKGLMLTKEQRAAIAEKGWIPSPHRLAPGCILYGQSYFEKTMAAIGGKYLLRGHDVRAPIAALNDRAITINTASHMTQKPYGIIVDPQKELRSLTDFKLVEF